MTSAAILVAFSAFSAVLAMLSVLCAPRLARAAAPGEGDADAQFKYGLAEMLAGRYATGCPALESSYRLDPRAGTLFTLAECQRKAGKTSSALSSYEEYLAVYGRMAPEQRAAQKERAAVATEERAALEGAVPRLVIELPAGATPGTIVQRDGATIGGAMMGVALPVDPGEHVVRTVTPDGRQRETRVVLADREQRTVIAELPPQTPQALPTAAQATRAPLPHAPSAANEIPVRPLPAEAPVSGGGSRRTWTYAVGAVGVAGLLVGATTGALAIAKRSTASSDCSASGTCVSQRGVDAGNSARDLANVATVGWVAGGIALAAAVILWLTEPRRPQGSVAGLAGTW
jgi:hypothetical protein